MTCEEDGSGEGKSKAVMKSWKMLNMRFEIFSIFDENPINNLDRVCVSIISVTVESMNE